MIAFCVAILAFVWRTGSAANTPESLIPLTQEQALGPRIAISAVFAFGLFNFWMVLRTFGTYSHLAVRRDRRSRFGGRHAGAGADERGEKDGRRGRPLGQHKRTGAMSDDEREREPGRGASDSMVGLGLTGLGGSPASVGAVLEDVDLEKGGERAYVASPKL